MNWKLSLMSLMLVGGTVSAAEGLKLGGFVDATYQWSQAANSAGQQTNTFALNDGAIYIGKSMGMGEVMIDVPFSTATSIAAAGNTNAILPGFGMAQAYVMWKYENGFMWKLGQFDTLYGFEANDSADRFFSHAGLISGGMRSSTHQGLQIGYDFSDSLGLHLLVANPGSAGNMTTGKPDVGFKIAANMDDMTASVGGLFYDNAGSAAWMFDIMAGSKMDALAIDLEVTLSKAASGADTGLGFLGQFVFEVDEMVAAGLRAEYTKLGDANTFGVAVGPDFSMNNDFKVRIDYGYTSASGTPDRATNSAITLSAVHRF